MRELIELNLMNKEHALGRLIYVQFAINIFATSQGKKRKTVEGSSFIR